MIISPMRHTDPDWTHERLLTVPQWSGEGRRERRRSRRGPEDECELSQAVRMLLVVDALEAIWGELALPVAKPHPDWKRTALGAVLGKVLAAELLRRAYVPKTFGDFHSLAEAFSLRN